MSKKKDEQELDTNADIGHNEEDDLIFDDLTDETPLTDRLKKIKEELNVCRQEKKEYLEGWQRAKADFINTRKRDEESRVSSVKAAKEDLVLSILPVLDSFEMAFGNKELFEHIDPDWVKGIQNIQNQLLGILKEHGVEQFDPTGQQFDPNMHDSIEMQATDTEKEDGEVLSTAQKGFSINGKVLRPAKVVVGEYK